MFIFQEQFSLVFNGLLVNRANGVFPIFADTLLVIRSVSDVLRAQSRFVKFVGAEAAGRTTYIFYKPTLGPKYFGNRPYNEFITPTTFT